MIIMGCLNHCKIVLVMIAIVNRLVVAKGDGWIGSLELADANY